MKHVDSPHKRKGAHQQREPHDRPPALLRHAADLLRLDWVEGGGNIQDAREIFCVVERATDSSWTGRLPQSMVRQRRSLGQRPNLLIRWLLRSQNLQFVLNILSHRHEVMATPKASLFTISQHMEKGVLIPLGSLALYSQITTIWFR
jgi:hypothetical protein